MRRIEESLERIAKILAGILLKDIQEGDQIQEIARLKQCGFENIEIAKMLGTTPHGGRGLHSLKSKKKGKRAKKGS